MISIKYSMTYEHIFSPKNAISVGRAFYNETEMKNVGFRYNVVIGYLSVHNKSDVH